MEDDPARLLEDTIVAVATPPGSGGVAVVRLSGRQARAMAQALLDPVALGPPREAVLRAIRDPGSGELLDRGLVTFFPEPQSYTGEDVVEFSTHGGWAVPGGVVEALRSSGARPAEPGEFTRRAYLNGKLDLVQAEAVGDLVGGVSRAQRDVALFQMERGLSVRLEALRERIVQVEALLMHHVDFPEEDEPPVGLAAIAASVGEVEAGLRELLATAPLGKQLRSGAVVVLAGPPNSGKSSLFNALVGEERAIVTPHPGTTRDAVDAMVSVGGFPVRLVDTAGLRQAGDPVERLGIEVAEGLKARADVLLLCLPVDDTWGDREEAFLEGRDPGQAVVVLRTLADLAQPGNGGESGGVDTAGRPWLRISVVSGEGMERLREVLAGLVGSGGEGAAGRAPVLTSERQLRGVREAAAEVGRFRAALESSTPADMAAGHLRGAVLALEEVLGVIPMEEVFDRVFSSFCIGK